MERAFFTVGIGASAGGLKPLSEFFDYLSNDLPAAFVVVTHLSREHPSMLSTLLSTHTHMPVIRVEHDMDLKPGNIYVLIENKTLTVQNARLLLEDRDSEIMNSAVNVFFESLAKDFGPKAIGMILSGGGHDGLDGAKLINKMGGNVIVQDPKSAEVNGMPLSIINHDHPTAILNAKDLALHLNKICLQVENGG